LRWAYAQPTAGPFDRLLRLHSASSALKAARPEQLADLALRAQWIDTLERAVASGTTQAEPAVATLLAEERARTEQQRAIEPHRAAALASLSELKRTLYPYQLEGVNKFLERGRLLLADDMGLGKTTQAIAACHTLFAAGALSRALLIVPTPLKSQWQREWQSTSSVPLYLVEGSPKERKQLYRDTQSGVLVLGYEQLLRDLPQVQAFAPELVVLDEAQRIKNWATKSAAYVKSLAPAYRLVLTGTPLENRFDELASIMDFVDDLTLEPKWRLLPFHAMVQQGEKESSGARNLDVLRARLATSMLRRTRKEVLEQLPSRTDTRIPVEMSEVQRARHDELRQPIAELSARAEQRSLTRGELMRLMQLLTTQRMICNGMAQVQFDSEWPRCEHTEPTPALLESLFAPKLSVLRGLVEQLVIAQGRKVVVFSQWRKFLRFAEWAVRDVLGAAGMRAVFFTGAESGAARERALEAFNVDPLATVLFASDAGAVGLNLQHAASCCINLELPWNPALLEQRIGRVHRLGQSQPCDIYNLVTEEGIEGRIAKLLEHKQALFSAVFDSTGDSVAFGGPARQGLLANVKQLADPWLTPLSAAPDSSTDMDLQAAVTQDTAESAETRTLAKQTKPKVPPTSTALEQHGIHLTQLADGGVRIEAPPELAARISALLTKFASELPK
jgi:SNF2 family DNA or RNA helicase